MIEQYATEFCQEEEGLSFCQRIVAVSEYTGHDVDAAGSEESGQPNNVERETEQDIILPIFIVNTDKSNTHSNFGVSLWVSNPENSHLCWE